MTVHWQGRSYRPVVYHTGQEEVPANAGRKKSKPHTDKFYHIILYIAGSGKFFWHDRLYTFRPGTAVLSWPGIPHHFHSQDGEELAYLEVTFSVEDDEGHVLRWPFSQLLTYYFAVDVSLDSGPWQTDELTYRKIEHGLNLLPRILYSDQRLRRVYAFQTLFDILTALIQEPPETGTEQQSTLSYRLEKAYDYIERNFNQPLDITQLAKQYNFSTGHFIRSFKSRFGTSPLACQQNLRLTVAERLLASGEYRVAEAARRVGYSNPYYFSRLFSKRRGVPPREFTPYTPD